MRPLPPGLGEYRDCRSRQDCRRFRQDWCQKLYNDGKRDKKEAWTWQRTDQKKGEYMNFGKVVEQYGYQHAPRQAILCAWNWCREGTESGTHRFAEAAVASVIRSGLQRDVRHRKL